MPTGSSPAEIITGQFVGWDSDLLGQVFGGVVRDQCAIVSEETAKWSAGYSQPAPS
jgi:hypothetical protein